LAQELVLQIEGIILFPGFIIAVTINKEKELIRRIGFFNDTVPKQLGVKWNLTGGLYWIRPFSFFNLDDPNRKYLTRDGGANVKKKVMLFFSNVNVVDPRRIRWSGLTYNRNNVTYKMLIYICYLVIQGMLLNEQAGPRKMARYIDDQRMHRLYEKFVLEYYRKHYPELKASASQIDWDIADGTGEFLPRMQSDITLQYQDKTVIIDTKYYEHTMQQNRFGDGQTLHSHNMYQIYTYVKNKDTNHSGKVSGVLLYAKTDEEIVPDHDYVIGGNQISVKTLDLNSPFSQIAKQLDALAERLLF